MLMQDGDAWREWLNGLSSSSCFQKKSHILRNQNIVPVLPLSEVDTWIKKHLSVGLM